MIPEFEENGLLPEGLHWATWQELWERFGITSHRRGLLSGLKIALDSLKLAGCKTAYIDGSFVTDKAVPNDFDACWESSGVDMQLLKKIDSTLLNFKNRRSAQKLKYSGELFPIVRIGGSGEPTWLDFFQTDRESCKRKGIIGIDVGGLP